MKLIESINVYKGFLKVFLNTYEVGEQTLTREILERGDSVAALVYNLDTHLYYFVSQPRPATFNKGVDSDNFIEVIAGMIDEGETPEQAIVREVKEELGFQNVINCNKIGEFFLSPGGCSEKLHLFSIGVTNKNKIETSGVDDENIKTVTMTFEELKHFIFDDAKSIIAQQYELINFLNY